MTSEAPERADRRAARGEAETKVITGATFAMCAIGGVFFCIYWWMGAPLLMWTVGAGVALGLLSLLCLRKTGWTVVFGNVSSAILGGVLLAIAYFSGGLESTGFSWLLLIPVVVAFVVGLRAAWAWLAVVWIAAFTFWMQGTSGAEVIPLEHATLNALFNRLGASLSLAIVATVFIRELRRKEGRLSSTNRALADEIRSRRSMESELRESQARYRDLVENSPMMIFTHDLEGRVLSANRTVLEFLGCDSESDLVGRNGAAFLAPEVRGESAGYLERVRTDGSASGLARVMTPDGKSKLFEYSSTLKGNGPDGPVVRGVARDVTEQEQARRALLRQVEQEELVSGIATRFVSVDGSDLPLAIETGLGELAGFAEVDSASLFLLGEHDGAIVQSYSWTAGGRDQELPDPVGSTVERYSWVVNRLRQLETIIVHDIDQIEPTAAAELRELLTPAVRSAVLVPLVGRDGLLGMLILATSGGPRRWLQENLVLAYISGYVFTSAILRVRNEERTLRLEKEIQQARRMESLGLVAGGIAHDFNNLLLGILGNAGLAQVHLAAGSDGWLAVDQIMESARRAAQLTNQMLSYSGSANLVPEVVDLGALVDESVAGLQGGALGSVEMDLWRAKSLPQIEVDTGQVRQVIRNLVMNAAEAMEGKPGRIQIRTGTVSSCETASPDVFRPLKKSPRPGAHVFVQIADTGCGIEAEDLARIFDPFFSTRFKGRGLGLAAVHGIVKGHEGVIEVMSQAGRGTTIRVLFPVAEGNLQSVAEEQTAEQDDSEQGSILVVDDEDSILAVVTRMLEISGFQVVAASSEQQAFDLVRRDGRDLRAMLLDFSLPQGDVAETLRELRTTGLDAPIIMMSGFSREQVLERVGQEQVAGFLEKPFGSQLLLSELQRVLEQ